MTGHSATGKSRESDRDTQEKEVREAEEEKEVTVNPEQSTEEKDRSPSGKQLLAGVWLHSSQRNLLGEMPATWLEHSPAAKQQEETGKTEVLKGGYSHTREEYRERERPAQAGTRPTHIQKGESGAALPLGSAPTS